MQFGKSFTTGVGLRIDAFGSAPRQITIGDHVQLGDYVHIAAVTNVTISDGVLIASKVFISDHNHGTYSGGTLESDPNTTPYSRPLSSKPVIIEKNVWIGESAHILPGVTIGAGSIIGAGAIVNQSIPQNCIAAGNPAKVLKMFDPHSRKWERVS